MAKQILKQDSKNFNKGTQEGDRLLEKSIKKFGFREAATLDKYGVLIGGNKRTAKAQKLGIKDVQIIKADKNKIYALQYDDIDLGTPEGRELALALNQTAKENICIDVELVEAELTDVVCEEWSIGTGGEPNAKNSEEFFIPDTIYNSNNIYDIPTLKLEKQATDIHLPLKPYGAEKRTNGGVGTYHFYVDDYRFESIWKDPSKIMKSGCTQIVEPNLSLYDTTPISYGLFLIYKKRWITRFFQEKGLNVYADLNVSLKFREYNVMGIPEGYNSFFTRGYTGRLQYLKEEHKIAQEISGKKEPNLVVYGGSKEVQEFCAKNNLTYIKDFINDK